MGKLAMAAAVTMGLAYQYGGAVTAAISTKFDASTTPPVNLHSTDSMSIAEKQMELAKQMNPTEKFQIGLAHMQGTEKGVPKDMSEAAKWFYIAAEEGNLDAMYNLAQMYYKGTGVDKDEHLAVLWYQKAADKGHAKSAHNLGIAYQNGAGGLEASFDTA
jgi:TPR repeat protein